MWWLCGVVACDSISVAAFGLHTGLPGVGVLDGMGWDGMGWDGMGWDEVDVVWDVM